MRLIKLLTLCFIMLFSSYTYAQSFNTEDFDGKGAKGTPVTEQQSQIYYNTCNKNRDERMSKDTQDTFCQCSAFGYKNNITQEDLHNMAQGTPEEKRSVMNKMLLKLYAPCMEFPVRDMVFHRCTKDAYQAGKQICSCMAGRMASYISKRAENELEDILKSNPNVYDPLEAITSSKSYEAEEKRVVLECIQGKK